jgi:hypothetical protein
MPNLPNNLLQRQVQRQYRLVRGLQATVYAQADPSADADLYQQLTHEEGRLHDLEQQLVAPRLPPPKAPPPRPPLTASSAPTPQVSASRRP